MSQDFKQRPSELTTAQFAMNFSNMEFVETTQRNADLLLVGNHPFGGTDGDTASKSIVATLHNSTQLPKQLREKLDPTEAQVLPELVLNCVLRETGLKAVVAAMMQERHIRSNVKAVEQCRFTMAELDVLRRAIIELGQTPRL